MQCLPASGKAILWLLDAVELDGELVVSQQTAPSVAQIAPLQRRSSAADLAAARHGFFFDDESHALFVRPQHDRLGSIVSVRGVRAL